MKCHVSTLSLLLLSTTILLPCTCSESTTLPTPDDFLVEGLENIQPAFGEFDGTMYAGRLPTDNQDGKIMFWLYESPTVNDKLVIWLNGGPGCSSFGGMLFENAPVTVPHYASGTLHSPSSPPLIANPYSWTKATSMLYVEQPAGTGFSTGPMPHNETDVASDFYGFLNNFYNVFADMKKKDLVIFGESYAGMYVPSIARKIHHENKKRKNTPEQEIPLQGIALGNGWIDATVQGPAVIDYAWWHGMIDLETKNNLQAQLKLCHEEGIVADKRLHKFNTPDECGTLEAVQAAAGKGVKPDLTGPNIYDVTTWDSYPFIFDPDGTFYQFFNSKKVQKILHAPEKYWYLCLPGEGRRRRRRLGEEEEKMLDQDRPVSVIPYIAELLDDAKIRVLIYNGDRDMSCCSQGSEMLLNDMNWTGSGEWKTAERGVWLVDDEPAGYSRITKNLEFVVVYNSGHLFPMNQPKTALDLVSRMVNGNAFLDAVLPVFEAPPKTATKETDQEGKTDSTSSDTQDADNGDATTETQQQPVQTTHRRHTGLLIIFSMAVGFIVGVFATQHYTFQHRQDYSSVPEVENGVEVSTSRYPWRWWTSHHGQQT